MTVTATVVGENLWNEQAPLANKNDITLELIGPPQGSTANTLMNGNARCTDRSFTCSYVILGCLLSL